MYLKKEYRKIVSYCAAGYSSAGLHCAAVFLYFFCTLWDRKPGSLSHGTEVSTFVALSHILETGGRIRLVLFGTFY